MTKAKPIDELDDSMRVLSTGTCETLSGSSKLTYHIGIMPDGEIYLRVYGNTGGGFFSQDWISLRDILTALKKRPEGKPITSILLNPLFKGRSAITPGFMMAVLLHEMETITCMITFLMPWNSSLLGICPMMNWPMP